MAPSNQRIEAVSWPGDGERLFVPLQDGRIAAIEARTGAVQYSTSNHSGATIGLEVSPDGTDLISVDTHGEFIRWSPATLVELDRFIPPPELGAANVPRDEIAFARSSSRFAAVGNDGLVLIHERASANPWRSLVADAIQLQDVAISDGDDLVAALANNNVIHVWRLDSGEKLATANLSGLWTLDPEGWNAGDGRNWRAEKLSWLAEGHTLAVSLAAGKALLIDMEDESWTSRIEGVLGNAGPTDSESTPNLVQRARRWFE
jgi:WD40 repeat protein